MSVNRAMPNGSTQLVIRRNYRKNAAPWHSADPLTIVALGGTVVHLSRRLVAVFVLGGSAWSQTRFPVAPVPADPLELATGPVQCAETPQQRLDAWALLNKPVKTVIFIDAAARRVP